MQAESVTELIEPNEALPKLMQSNRDRMQALARDGFEMDPIGLIADQITILIDILPKSVQEAWMTRVELALCDRLNRAETQAEEVKSKVRQSKLLEGVRA